MERSRRLALLGMAAMLAGATPAVAQPADGAAYTLSLEGGEPVVGLGAPLAVVIVEGRTRAPVADARVSGARLISPFGAVAPLAAPPEEAATPGLRLFRADLPTPGAWTLELTVSAPGRRPATATVGFEVLPPPGRAGGFDPAGPSIAAAGPGGSTAGPAVVAPGPAAAGAAAATVAPTRRSTGYSPEAAPFCATCATEAPH